MQVLYGSTEKKTPSLWQGFLTMRTIPLTGDITRETKARGRGYDEGECRDVERIEAGMLYVIKNILGVIVLKM